jgi:hypothetical protein
MTNPSLGVRAFVTLAGSWLAEVWERLFRENEFSLLSDTKAIFGSMMNDADLLSLSEQRGGVDDRRAWRG